MFVLKSFSGSMW